MSPEPVRVARAVTEEPQRKVAAASGTGVSLSGIAVVRRADSRRSAAHHQALPSAAARWRSVAPLPMCRALRSAPTRAANLDLGLEPPCGARGGPTPLDGRWRETPARSERGRQRLRRRQIRRRRDRPAHSRGHRRRPSSISRCRFAASASTNLGILPRAPLFAFLLVQNGGYLVAFTAGGQTLGKMLAGIKVVSAEPRSSLDLGRAFVRELVWLVLAVPAGLGLLTVLSRDRRGVHDRFAGTRVIRG